MKSVDESENRYIICFVLLYKRIRICLAIDQAVDKCNVFCIQAWPIEF
jgi:hypothetical protein